MAAVQKAIQQTIAQAAAPEQAAGGMAGARWPPTTAGASEMYAMSEQETDVFNRAINVLKAGAALDAQFASPEAMTVETVTETLETYTYGVSLVDDACAVNPNPQVVNALSQKKIDVHNRMVDLERKLTELVALAPPAPVVVPPAPAPAAANPWGVGAAQPGQQQLEQQQEPEVGSPKLSMGAAMGAKAMAGRFKKKKMAAAPADGGIAPMNSMDAAAIGSPEANQYGLPQQQLQQPPVEDEDPPTPPPPDEADEFDDLDLNPPPPPSDAAESSPSVVKLAQPVQPGHLPPMGQPAPAGLPAVDFSQASVNDLRARVADAQGRVATINQAGYGPLMQEIDMVGLLRHLF